MIMLMVWVGRVKVLELLSFFFSFNSNRKLLNVLVNAEQLLGSGEDECLGEGVGRQP